MEGGRNGITIAPVIWLNAPNSWPVSAFAECASPGRSLKSFSCSNRIPWFGADPAKLKPPAANIRLCSGSFDTIPSTCLTMPIV